jgi:hypothetical protein
MRRIIFISLLAVGTVSAGLFSYVSARAHAETVTEASLSTTPFTETIHHFTLRYPTGDDVRVWIDTELTRTVAFESADNPTQSFQIFMQPYEQSEIATAQFRTDDPSGVMEDVSTTTIDGVPAKTFVGYNDQMGPTSEVWFIHGGTLYEVTTYQSSAAWLQQILQTWRFI